MNIQYTKTGATKHSDTCIRVFAKYDMTCPRCQELAKGLPARDGWQKRYYEAKRKNEANSYYFLKSEHCEHGIENINPGGYCNVCGKGRDFS